MATTTALTWCVIELNASIIGGCVSTIKPFLREYFPSILGHSSSGRSKTYINTNRYTYNTNRTKTRGSTIVRMSKFDPLSSTFVAGGDAARDLKTSGGISQECIMRKSSDEHWNSDVDVEKGLSAATSENGGSEDAQIGGIVKTVEYSHSYETPAPGETISVHLND